MQQIGERLKEKVAIVTGAGSRGEVVGIGQATAILFARQRASVLVVDKDERNAHRTLSQIETEGGRAWLLVADVTQSSACQEMVEAAVSCYGGLNILFDNAGFTDRKTVIEVEEDNWDRVVEVNLKGTMLSCKYAIPAMIRNGGGVIINISSIDGMRTGWRPNVPYAAAKGGVIAMPQNMAVHHGRDNIRVNSIAPGQLWGPFVGPIPAKSRELRRRANPLGAEGTAWDVAWASVFLASEGARWISGVVLPVDGEAIVITPLSMLGHLCDD